VLYDRLIELDPQRPSAHMGLSQALMHIAEERLRAHQHACFAVALLVNEPERVVQFAGAQISLRGLAGVQALSTIDAMEGVTEESWRRHTTKLAEDTVDSFAAAAEGLGTQSVVPGQVVFPPVASAAINRYLAAACIGSCPPMDFREERLSRQVDKAADLLQRTRPDRNLKLGDRPVVLAEVWKREP
jgi:succinate dehydrogenase/fumarate reductase flavoprotein subunit